MPVMPQRTAHKHSGEFTDTSAASQVPLVQRVQLYASREEEAYNKHIFLTLKYDLQQFPCI